MNRECLRKPLCNGKLDSSSAAKDVGEESAGEDSESSNSVKKPASTDAARPLDTSVSETNAKDD